LTAISFFLLLFIVGYVAGVLGALTGLGGGIVLTPVLVLLLDVNIYYAMGVSIIAVITTSSGTAIAYLRDGYTSLRIGMFLETAAVVGAIIGACIIALINTHTLSIIFGLVLLLSAYLSWHRVEEDEYDQPSHPWALAMQLEGDYPVFGRMQHYAVQGVPLAWGLMLIAGILSSLLGIGAGVLKVLAMDHIMRLPYKVATATSNFIIGITATVSVGIYFSRGFVNAELTAPAVMGVLFGSITGAAVLRYTHVKTLRGVFSIVVFLLALEMIYKGLIGAI